MMCGVFVMLRCCLCCIGGQSGFDRLWRGSAITQAKPGNLGLGKTLFRSVESLILIPNGFSKTKYIFTGLAWQMLWFWLLPLCGFGSKNSTTNENPEVLPLLNHIPQWPTVSNGLFSRLMACLDWGAPSRSSFSEGGRLSTGLGLQRRRRGYPRDTWAVRTHRW